MATETDNSVVQLVGAKLLANSSLRVPSPERLPDVSSDEAPATAATKLRLLLKHLEKGEVPLTIIDLRRTLSYAADVLTKCSTIINSGKSSITSTEVLCSVKDAEIREWLLASFTRGPACSLSSSRQKPLSFKNVATTLMIGKYIENMYKDRVQVKTLQYPMGVSELFETLDNWGFSIFQAETLTSCQPLRFMGYELFKRHNLLSAHKISPVVLDAFLCQVEKGYKAHNNFYHNETHGADVLQTVHALICSARLEEVWLSSLEVLALLLAAIIHDVDHPGTTNTFQIKTHSDYALCYNDRSVLENHHLHYAFKLLRQEEFNILQSLSLDEFTIVRGLVIDMILATDMSEHFEQLKQMRLLLSNSDSQLSEEHRSKILCLLLHAADISHPGKPWDIHREWTSRITEEFFRQGDWEKELALSPSPLCDRNTTLLPQSSIGFIDYIVSPMFDVCGDMLELLASSDTAGATSNGVLEYPRPWLNHLTQNKERWTQNKERWNAKCTGKCTERSNHLQSAKEEVMGQEDRACDRKQQVHQTPTSTDTSTVRNGDLHHSQLN